MVIKKLIAISVVFALVAGAAFAVDLGGAVITSVKVAESTAGADATLFSGGGVGRARIEGSGEAEIGIGSIGGWIRFDVDTVYLGGGGDDKLVAALAWWQPIEQLRIQLSHNKDGHFDTSHIGRYGFYAQANEIGGLVTSDGNWGSFASYDNAIFGGYDGFDFALIITPMEGLTINVALPWNQTAGTDTQPAATFKKAFFQVNYNADFGAIHVTYQGVNSATVMGNFYANAFIGMIENLGLEVGLKFGIAAEGAPKPPLAIALGAKYDVSEQFGVKLRSVFEIPMESGGKANIRVDLLPYYAINESVTAYLDAGILVIGGGDTTFHIGPYVRVGSEWGPGFYAGLRIANAQAYTATKDAKMSWSVPIGLIAQF